MLQLAEMARLGVQPDNIAATALLDACARNRKMEMASSVFEELFGADASRIRQSPPSMDRQTPIVASAY